MGAEDRALCENDGVRIFAGWGQTEVVLKNKDAIATKVLANEIAKDATFAISKEWNINGEKTTISVERV